MVSETVPPKWRIIRLKNEMEWSYCTVTSTVVTHPVETGTGGGVATVVVAGPVKPLATRYWFTRAVTFAMRIAGVAE